MIINKIKFYKQKKWTRKAAKFLSIAFFHRVYTWKLMEPRFPRNLRQGRGGEGNNAKNVRVQTSCGLTRAASLLSCRPRRKRLLATGSFFQSPEINFDTVVEVEDSAISRPDEKVVAEGEFEKQRNEKKSSSVFLFWPLLFPCYFHDWLFPRAWQSKAKGRWQRQKLEARVSSGRNRARKLRAGLKGG